MIEIAQGCAIARDVDQIGMPTQQPETRIAVYLDEIVQRNRIRQVAGTDINDAVVLVARDAVVKSPQISVHRTASSHGACLRADIYL